MNKLCEQNNGFAEFIDNLRKDDEVRAIHAAEYEKVRDDPEPYTRKMKKSTGKR